MLHKLSETFTATHLTAILVAAIFAPTALYAVTYTNVAITDAKSGSTAYVDPTHHLNTYDPIAGYANNPANYVKMSGNVPADGSYHTIYNIPAEKSLILKSVNMSFYGGTSGADNYTYIYDAGTTISFITGFDDPNTAGAHYSELGSGWYLTSGDSLQIRSVAGADVSMSTEYSIEGYLVPSTAVPTSMSEDFAQYSVQHGSAVKR